MKYSVIKITNGAFSVDSEWTDKTKAYTRFHTVCSAAYNAEDVETACIAVIDEKMNIYKTELIGYIS